MPIDDDNTLSVGWFFDRVPHEMEPFKQDRIPYWYGPIKDEKTGRWITSHVMNQDFIAWVGPGRRRRPHAGAPGRERPRRHHDAQAPARAGRSVVAGGGEPKALIRDAEQNDCVELPIIGREHFVKGYSRANIDRPREGTPGLVLRKDFVFQAGQPEEIRQAFHRAMGLDAEVPRDVRSPG